MGAPAMSSLVRGRKISGYDRAEVEQIQQCLAELNLPGTRYFTIGTDIGLRDGNWDFVIVADFDDVAAYRAEWQAQITRDGEVVGDSQEVAEGRFGTVVGDHLAPIPAPVLPNARLKERR